MKTQKIKQLFFLIIIASIFAFSGCKTEFDINKVEPEISIPESLIAGPKSIRQVIGLTSSYPWFAEPSEDWIKLTRNRGQALQLDSIVFSCDENYTMEDREGWIEVKLMDQMSKKVKVIQRGRGSLITLSQNLVYFNRQGGEVIIDVITNQDWDPEAPSKDGFTFVKVGKNQLKIVATANSTNKDKTTEIKLKDKGNTTDASLSIIQKPTDKILFISLEKEKKDVLFMKESSAFDIPVTLNVDYDAVPSASWIKITSAPNLSGNKVQDVKISLELTVNGSGAERGGFVVIKEKGSGVEAKDTLFVSQKGKNKTIYVKPNGTGDGTSWEYAFGSIHDAMAASTADGDMEIWVASGQYQFKSTLNWKAVNVYGGFSGNESRHRQRKLKNKPVFLGGAFNFMTGYASSTNVVWMDGIIFANSDNYQNKGVGSFEIYNNHGFRNCEFRNIRHGNAVLYLLNCFVENSVFSSLETQRYLLRADNTVFNNVTVANCLALDWNSNYIYGNSKLYNSIFWDIKITAGTRFRALTIGGSVTAINCAIQSGLTEKGLVPTNCIELNSNNNVATGPNFVDPSGTTPNYTLKTGSILVDAGNSAHAKGFLDVSGNARIIGSSVDIGAYEQ